jgi:NAD(P)-dependent dehydrogenase (short-subunit alcohol dehydrogenase family)
MKSAQPRGAALVTGGASGIGRAVCFELAARGWPVGILDIDGDQAAEVSQALAGDGALAAWRAADVACESEVERAVAELRSHLAPFTVLVHAAGICTFVPLPALSTEIFDRTLAVHVRGAFLCVRAVLPDMHAAGWGRIVTISSVAGLNGGGPALCHYAAAKAGLVGLTKAWALELGPQGITCNVVAPGLVDTPLIRAAGMSEEMIREMERRAPLRRIGQPKDVAAAVAYLVSEEASFVTGQVLSPNGGVYL